MAGREFQIGNVCLFVHCEKGLFLSVYVDDIKLAGRKQIIGPTCKILTEVANNPLRRRAAYDVVAGLSLDHADNVEQLTGHQGVAHVTKILDPNEAILTESGRRELERVSHTQRKRCSHLWSWTASNVNSFSV